MPLTPDSGGPTDWVVSGVINSPAGPTVAIQKQIMMIIHTLPLFCNTIKIV